MTKRQFLNRHAALVVSVVCVLCVALTSTPCGCAVQQDKSKKGRWIKLFNGKNLEGWKVKIAGHKLNDNYGNTFRVEDGILKACYDEYEKFDGKFGHLFYKDKFSFTPLVRAPW